LYGIYQENTLVAAFPLVQLESRIFKNYSLPFLTPYSGCFSVQDEMLEKDSFQIYIDFIKKMKKDEFYVAFPPSMNKYLSEAKINLEQHLTHIIDLNKEEGELFSNLKTDKRRNINAAVKEGLKVSFEKDTKILSSLITKTYKRQGKENHWISSGLTIAESFEHGFQVTVFDKDIPLSSLYVAYDKERAYYLFGGYDDALNNYNAGPFAMWSAIKKAKSLGLKIFDFEGSEIEPIKKYFQRFGPKEQYYFSFHQTSILQKIYKKIR
jgi:lipid II:glycine glycyltransferase (peptidoglycan interpeptide bridge formation enzyme)